MSFIRGSIVYDTLTGSQWLGEEAVQNINGFWRASGSSCLLRMVLDAVAIHKTHQ